MSGSERKFFNRELSWLEFNARVLAEAKDPANPLFDRLKFIGIVSSNFDEFFMVRIPNIKNTSQDQEVLDKAYQILRDQNEYFSSVMVPELEKAGISRIPVQQLTEEDMGRLKDFFYKVLFPVLTPIALLEEKAMPVLLNLSLYLLFSLMDPKEKKKRYAVAEIPKNFPRIITLPSEKEFRFVLLEDIVGLYAKELFKGYEVVESGLIRLTRGAEFSFDEGKDEDFAKVMSEALLNRNQSDITRLEISAPEEWRELIKTRLEVREEDLFPVETWFDLKSISQLAYQPIFQELRRPAWIPLPAVEFQNADDLWELLKEKDVWVHHPYESFDAVKQFVAAAADDPDVLAIKQTLYRAGQDSSIVSSLERAAMKGKRVTVLVELKARFDEERNIEWARRLELAGASVLYGVAGLKTHAKACLVVRNEPEGIKRYVHLSTGNYNEKTAALYSDIGFFTSDEGFANDLSAFFNMITGFSQPIAWTKIEVAPYGLRRTFLRLIRREILKNTKEKPGLILAKMNSLVDQEIIDALYQASKAGVQVKLNIRGVCCLRPGMKNFSENIEVVSLVDMFLEHSRMFYFANGGDDELYLSSADWMPRNLDGRIEIMFPVDNREMKKELTEILKCYFRDNIKSWKLLPDGSYQKLQHESEKKFRAQDFLCKRFSEKAVSFLKTVPRELKPQRPKFNPRES